MIIKRLSIKNYGSCNFCKRGEYFGGGLIYPYKEVTYFTGETSRLAATICDDCLNELVESVKIKELDDES